MQNSNLNESHPYFTMLHITVYMTMKQRESIADKNKMTRLYTYNRFYNSVLHFKPVNLKFSS